MVDQRLRTPQEHGAAGRRDRLRLLLRGLRALGPVAAAFTTYGLLVDLLPSEWFGVAVLRYVLALLGAGVVGLGARALLQLSAVQDYIRGDRTPALPSAQGPAVHDLVVSARRRLVEEMRPLEGHPRMHGWGHFLGQELPPSAIGTAYGLRLVLALDLQHARLDRRRLVEALLALQRKGGGWAARSQKAGARPEVTAWVLLTAARAGLGSRDRARLVALLERLITGDPVGPDRTAVVTAVVSALAEVAPASPVLADLAPRLAAGARADRSWGERTTQASLPSVPHTARAVVALRQAADVLPDHTGLEAAARAGREWLCGDVDLGNRSEAVRRPVGTEHDTIAIDHFTAAWVARALLSAQTPPLRPLRTAIQEVLRSQEDGIWTWTDSQPIWMTYQGLAVLRGYSLRNLPWPP